MRCLYHALLKLAVALVLLSATAIAQDTPDYPELPRFHQVSERLYRSGQPGTGGINRLRELGINTVINLRGTGKLTRAEEAEALAAGLNYFNVALPNWGRPQDARVARVLDIIAAPESGRVLIHCKDGVDRTGMIVAIERMTYEGWSTDKALAEAERNGMRRHQVWMRDYARDYGARVRKVGPETMLLKSPGAGNDFDDRIGVGMRVVEREASRATRFGGRFLRRVPGAISSWFGGF